ncbi:hypothetical protein H9660_07325 [Clostridium sp. Sa3CUN1]|uniref:Uncharacterized protein n=1 Tax=Clostridium gallinarum TaxID=2762246 RepID=A0ABR8Q3F9_9CLOT|nr:hypothetical protein [Clostridium gallinarum]MBD7914956.1 hypothetical protein [Clostridium gallinarum]
MKNNRISLIQKIITGSLVWFALSIIVGILITKFTQFNSLQDVLFVEGLLLIFIGIFSSISADSISFFLNGGFRTYRSKINLLFSLGTFSLFVAGVMSSVITFIM